uniref:Putative transmembrane protein n=1 Tax=Pithovirus LCPAC403 TaxID=2506596 RepID=A0A481ZAS8_9VIRU|nr:MAG: putative transmembrane protein [Pithovirus LCPAC403]
MSNSAVIVFKLIARSIVDDKPKDVTKYLDKLPLEKMNSERTDQFLNNLLLQCLNLTRQKCCRAVMKRFIKLNPNETHFSTFCQIFTSMKFSKRVLSFVMQSHPKESFLDLAHQYIENADSSRNVVGIKRLDEVLGDQNLQTYEILYVTAFEGENDFMAEYFAGRVAELSPHADIPDWVKNFSDEKELPIENEFYIPWIYDKLAKSSNIYIDMVNEKLRKQDVDGTEHDIDLFRVLGPPNPSLRFSVPLVERNTVFDGPRMFICDQNDYEDDEMMSYDWFNNSCDSCLFRIKRRWHAVRRPQVGGGWIGSYCGFQCMRDDFESENWLLMQLVDDLEDLMNKIGIQDRRDAE